MQEKKKQKRVQVENQLKVPGVQGNSCILPGRRGNLRKNQDTNGILTVKKGSDGRRQQLQLRLTE